MGLDRDELAARVLVAFASHHGESDPGDDAASFAVGWADALIARLRPATVAPVADTPEPRRTVGAVVRWDGQQDPDEEWLLVGNKKAVALKVRRPYLLDCGTNLDGGGDYFVRWATREECERHGIPYVERGAAPSPAASPAAYVPTPAKSGAAAYVPQVGDVVRFKDCDNFAEILVVRVDDPKFYGKIITQDGFYRDEAERDSAEYRYIRPATAAERAAAGLPPITPDHPQGGQGAEAEGRVGDQRVAAGLDAPAFDEASEREAAVDIAKDRGLDVAEEVGFVAGWLARARIAANGGVA